MDVKTAVRTLDLFEAFTGECKPLSLSDIARAIGAPVSSCFGLVNTLEKRGYLYSFGARRSFYPTRKMLENVRRIAVHDPLADIARPVLEALSAKSGETVLFARRSGDRVVYVDVIESAHKVRYAASAGEFFPIHCSATGKAILASLAEPQRREVIARLKLERVTPNTLTRKSALAKELAISSERGWFVNRGEHIADVMAVAVPVHVQGEVCALAIAGPIHRIEDKLDKHLKALRALLSALEKPTKGVKQ
jgi:DNA-binding IclR family transcriptional regulator